MLTQISAPGSGSLQGASSSAGGQRLGHRAPMGRRAGPTWLPAGPSPSVLVTAGALPLALSHSEASQWVHLPDISHDSVPGLDTWAEPGGQSL